MSIILLEYAHVGLIDVLRLLGSFLIVIVIVIVTSYHLILSHSLVRIT
jgi:hypothetical protein